jgi:hypothetical protein
MRRLLGTERKLEWQCFAHDRTETDVLTDYEWFRVLLMMAREVLRLPKPRYTCPKVMLAIIRNGPPRTRRWPWQPVGEWCDTETTRYWSRASDGSVRWTTGGIVFGSPPEERKRAPRKLRNR